MFRTRPKDVGAKRGNRSWETWKGAGWTENNKMRVICLCTYLPMVRSADI
jgi:hypothetical protein